MKIGDTYRNFVVKLSQDLPEIESKLIEVEHTPTGATIMMIVNNDDENVFNISIRTCPQDSSGVAHVLEHMALCGSENYPVRDPFFSMTRRSLNTFMNAFTGADFTCYPAASQIPEDFYHLLSVYIDAVFHPLLTENSFLQEAWRYERAEDGSLCYTGIVFNEMKGALLSGESRLSEAMNAALFPSVTYGVNSGGDPKAIVSLNLETVRAFHESQYTLGRCLFYFYGNIRPTRHLDFLEEKLLRRVGKIEKQNITLPLQKRFKEPVRVMEKYPSDGADEDKVLFGLAWLTCSIFDQQDLLALHVLELVLMGTDAAPLKSRLLKSGLCKQADMSIDSELHEIPVYLVCKGCSHSGSQKLESMILASLEEILQEGIPFNLVEGAVHQLELARKEITGYSLPYGLSLFFRAGLLRQHGGKAEDGLRIHTLFANLRENIQNPEYLPRLVRKYFLDNPHYARVISLPDSQLIAQENKEERSALQAIQMQMSAEDLERVEANSKRLEAYQAQEEDLNKVLPLFSLDKVPSLGKEFVLDKETFGEGEVLHHDCFTNDIIFLELVFDLPALSVEELPWLRLLVFVLLQLGSGGRSYKEQLEFLLENTGGVDVLYDFSSQATDSSRLSPSISIRGKALISKAKYVCQVMKETLTSVDFSDTARLKELLMQHAEALTNSVRNSPMGYAIGLACCNKSIAGGLAYRMSGLPYVKHICELLSHFDQRAPEIIDRLQQLYKKCFVGRRQLIISSSRANYQVLHEQRFFGLLDERLGVAELWKNPSLDHVEDSRGLVIPARGAYNVLAIPLGSLSYDHPDAAVLSVAAEVLGNVILHTKIREQGGAYGSGANANLGRGAFYCYSYRDPEVSATYQVFLQGIRDMAAGKFSEEDVHEGILGVIQNLDDPISPGSRGSTSYYRSRSGKVPFVRQAFRQAVLATTKEQICEVVRKRLETCLSEASFVSFAGEEMLQKSAEELDRPFQVESAL
ncbi:insulinase family metalloproteinase [Chlamydia suis MD56]|uniref:insulinase family protein n=1 Tax=Chlamydia suis TaxID=83559 RepID=UPI0003BFED8A|nr:insulinase family protein [Chlamydia suis]ESN88946.1 insulinase family metalloproteinase [Chlamydia suis MD56]SIU03876.1 metalloprotease, insulinase family,Peptidase M16C associated [Chlamydia suis]